MIWADRGPKQTQGGLAPHLWTETRSGSDGRYRLFVEGDTYEIWANAPKIGFARLQKQTIGDNTSIKLDIPLKQGVTFRARVVDSLTGKPVRGLKLHNWSFPWIEGISDAQGRIEIGEMPPGRMALDVEVKEYARWWSEEATEADQHYEAQKKAGIQRNIDYLTFDLQPGMKEITIKTEPAVKITGRVVDPDGKPVAGATVAPALTGSGNSITGDTRYSFETQSDGTFEMYLPATGNGTYNIIAHDGKYGEYRTWANGVLDPIQTRPGQTIGGVTITLTRPATVTGVVIDKNGKELPNIEVQASDVDCLENRYYVPKVRSDASGRFSLKYIRPGKHYIQAAPFYGIPKQAPKESISIVNLKSGERKDGIKLVGGIDPNSRGRSSWLRKLFR